MKGVLKKLGRFETHHRILVFSIILVATIILMRIGVQFWNPNPVIFNLELHHFDYGVILLLFVVKLLLFGSKKYQNVYLVLAAVASAFVVDGYLALRLSVVEDPATALQTYNNTIGSVVVGIGVSTLTVLFVRSILKRRDTMPEHKR